MKRIYDQPTLSKLCQQAHIDTIFDADKISFFGCEYEKGVVLRTAMVHRYELELELIQPIANTKYKQWLEERGPGIYHMAFDLKDSYEDVLAQCQTQTRKEPCVRGTGIYGMLDFSYLDLREETGIIVECCKSLQPGKPAIPYDLKANITPGNEGREKL